MILKTHNRLSYLVHDSKKRSVFKIINELHRMVLIAHIEQYFCRNINELNRMSRREKIEEKMVPIHNM